MRFVLNLKSVLRAQLSRSSKTGFLKSRPVNFVQKQNVGGPGVHSSEYTVAYSQTLPCQEYMETSLMIKSHVRDMENDLFCQLNLGTANGEDNGFSFETQFTYPAPRLTVNDKPDNLAVIEVLNSVNPHFVYKLKVSFFCRILTQMFDKIYGRHIEDFEYLAEQAYLSLEKTPSQWANLEDHIRIFLIGAQPPDTDRPEVYTLCRDIEPLMFYHGNCSLATLARNMYTYLDHYGRVQFDPSTSGDDRVLTSQGTPHSVFLMYMASIVKMHEGSFQMRDVTQYTRQTRDFKGYIQCVFNICHLPISYYKRKELVSYLSGIRNEFVATEAQFYTQDKYEDFVWRMAFIILPQFPEFDLQRNGVRYSDIMKDLYKSFLIESERHLELMQ